MNVLIRAARIVMRAALAVLVILGILFWAGRELQLVPAHMLIGVLFVLSLWVLAVAGAFRRIPLTLTIVAVLWGFIVFWLGLNQAMLLPNSAHWIVETAHLLVGLIGAGLAEGIALRALRANATAA